MKVLFLDTVNLFEQADPIADLVEVYGISKEEMKALELTQRGVHKKGGNWRKIMTKGKIRHRHISNGRESDYKESEFDIKYTLIIGNY